MNKSDIINLLNTNDRAIGRALIALNKCQTFEERDCGVTINKNGRGFTPADAYMGTSMAKYYEKFGKLSEKQLLYWKKPNAKGVPRINKYANQLLEIALVKAAIHPDDAIMNKIVYDAEMESEHRAFDRKFKES
jgi:hypothetical protein